MMVPKLRFPGYTDDWRTVRLGDVTTKVGSGSTPRGGSAVYKKSGVPFIRSQNVKGGELDLTDVVFIDEKTHRDMSNSAVRPNDVLLNITGASLGRTCVVPTGFKEGNLSQHVCIVRLDKTNPSFVHVTLSRPRSLHDLLKTQTGGGKEGLNFQAVRSFKLNLPDASEQRKIAEFLTVVDKRITRLEQNIEKLNTYKRGVMQKIFAQEIRFSQENNSSYSNWREIELNAISKRIIERNKYGANDLVLTNSATGGVVRQGDYFEKDIANKNKLSNYFIVPIDAFVYNPRISSHAPVGPIKRNRIAAGLMSPLYSVFEITTGNKDFFDYYFQTNLWHGYLRSVANSGARYDRMNITTIDLYKMLVPYPSLEEQQKITDFLAMLDRKIKLTHVALRSTREFRQTIIQKILV